MLLFFFTFIFVVVYILCIVRLIIMLVVFVFWSFFGIVSRGFLIAFLFLLSWNFLVKISDYSFLYYNC